LSGIISLQFKSSIDSDNHGRNSTPTAAAAKEKVLDLNQRISLWAIL